MCDLDEITYNTDIENIHSACLDPSNHKFLADLSTCASKMIVDKCIVKGVDQSNQDVIVNVFDFFNAFPKHYMIDITHHTNTCFLAASMWMFGSMRLLIKMLYFNRSNSSRDIIPLIDVMYPLYERKNRSRLVKIHESCSIYPEYIKGAQDDLMLNLDAILDRVNPTLLNRLFVSYTTNKTYTIIDDDDNTLSADSPMITSYFDQYKSIRNEVYDADIQNRSRKYIDSFNELFPVDLLIPRVNVSRNFQRIAKMENFPDYKDITTFDRFCGQTSKHSIPVNKYICELFESYTTANKLLQYVSTPDETELSGFVHTMSVSEYKSVQTFLSDYEIAEPEIDIITNEIYKVRHTTVSIASRRAYLIIRIKFQGKTKKTKKATNIVGGNLNVKLDIQDRVIVGNESFILTSVGVKSGSIEGGHWWSLVRDVIKDEFIRYDDSAKLRSYSPQDIYKTGGNPSVLIYTNERVQGY
jgi:hypothetical protein